MASDNILRGGLHREGVVLLHGFGGLPIQTAMLARWLRAEGYAVINPLYPSWRWSLEQIVEHLHPLIMQFAAPLEALHCVGHSMGGLVLRAILAGNRPSNLGRVVMLGPPNGGSELADLAYRLRLNGLILNQAGQCLRTSRSKNVDDLLGKVDYPLGIIAGNKALNPLFANRVLRLPHDGKVTVAATRIEGQSDHLVLPVSHTAMIYNRAVALQVATFLREGRFRAA